MLCTAVKANLLDLIAVFFIFFFTVHYSVQSVILLGTEAGLLSLYIVAALLTLDTLASLLLCFTETSLLILFCSFIEKFQIQWANCCQNLAILQDFSARQLLERAFEQLVVVGDCRGSATAAGNNAGITDCRAAAAAASAVSAASTNAAIGAGTYSSVPPPSPPS